MFDWESLKRSTGTGKAECGTESTVTAYSVWSSVIAISFYFAAAKLIIHFIFNGQYGYFRDELYFLACAENLDWGYVDHAPLVAFAAKVSREILGDSLFAIRFLPAVAGSLKVLITGLLVLELGGRRLAVTIASLCVLLAPGFLIMDNLLTMNAFEPVFWLGCAYCVIRMIRQENPQYWIPFGLFAGVGLMNKHSMLFFGFAIVVGLFLTKARSLFLSKWFLLGGLTAFLIFLPNIIWQWQHDWATLDLLKNVKVTGKNVDLSPFEFILRQFLPMSPFAAPVWLSGLYFYLIDSDGKRFRVFGIAYVLLVFMMILLEGKDYYLFPIYPILFAAGGVLIGRFLETMKGWNWVKYTFLSLLIVPALVISPLFLPVLPVERLIQYQRSLGLEVPKSEVGHSGPLPQYFGDQFGWEEMVEKVAETYKRLSPEDKSKAAIFASNYGEAGAIDFFGRKYGLPKAISPHQNYFLWGPRGYDGEIMIVLQGKKEQLEEQFESVEEAGEVAHPFSMGEEQFTIYLCRRLKQPIGIVWPQIKHWN